MFSVELTGLEKFMRQVQYFHTHIPDAIQKALLAIAEDLEAEISGITPVDTGELKRSWDISDIRVENGNYIIDVTNDETYMRFQNYGTKYMKGKHFLEISCAEVEKRMAPPIHAALEELIK
jgi:HK97 gp10 family phage protein